MGWMPMPRGTGVTRAWSFCICPFLKGFLGWGVFLVRSTPPGVPLCQDKALWMRADPVARRKVIA
jgi:hypothetical protein